jgi:hypothetical protein
MLEVYERRREKPIEVVLKKEKRDDVALCVTSHTIPVVGAGVTNKPVFLNAPP